MRKPVDGALAFRSFCCDRWTGASHGVRPPDRWSSMCCTTFPYERGWFFGIHVLYDQEEQRHDSQAESCIDRIGTLLGRMKSEEKKKSCQCDHRWHQNTGSTCAVRRPPQHHSDRNNLGYSGGYIQKDSSAHGHSSRLVRQPKTGFASIAAKRPTGALHEH